MTRAAALLVLAGCGAAQHVQPTTRVHRPTRDIDGDGFDDRLDSDRIAFGGPGERTLPLPWEAPLGIASRVVIAGDIDGDGFADVAVGDPACGIDSDDHAPCGVGALTIYRGGRSGLSAPWAHVAAPGGKANGLFGSTLVPLGDVDGDGRADLLVGGFDGTYLCLGGATGLGPPSAVHAEGAVVPAGDVNGDGRADLLLLPRTVLLGGEGGLDPARSLLLPDDPFAMDVHVSAAAGDFDGDGFGDLAVGVARTAPEGWAPGRVVVFRGGRTQLEATAAVLTQGEPNDRFGLAVAAGDIDGDGYVDLVVGADGAAYVYRGSPSGLETTAPRPVPGRLGLVEPLGDVDGDGRADFALDSQLLLGSDITRQQW